MRLQFVHPAAFWSSETGRVEYLPGEEAIEVADEHARVAVAEGWAVEVDVPEVEREADETEADDGTGAPARRKAAARRAPEQT